MNIWSFGELGDMLISSYNVNLSSMGSVHCSPLINPVLLDYSHNRAFRISRSLNTVGFFMMDVYLESVRR